MADVTTEIERKYDAADAGEPILTGLPGVAGVVVRPPQRLDAVYLDSPDLALARHRITLRRRTGGDDAGWHLKLPAAGGDARTEVGVPFDDDGPLDETGPTGGVPSARVPAALTDGLQGYLRGREPVPVAVVGNTRRITELHGPDGAVLAVLCVDDVTTRSLLPSAGTDCWVEWEFELVTGDRGLLEAADAELRRAGATPSPSPSKLARALGPDAPEFQRHPAESTEALLASVVSAQRDELYRLDATLRVGDEEALHDARVASRRARSALEAYGVSGDAAQDELKHYAAVLGAARDYDVATDRFRSRRESMPAGADLDGVLDRIAELRRDAAAAAVDYLSGERYHALLDTLDERAEAPAVSPDVPSDAAEAAADAVAHARRRLRKAKRTARRSGDVHDRHRLRKRAKRLRYLAEGAARASSGKTADAYQALVAKAKHRQTKLGDLTDAAFSLDIIAALAADPRATTAQAVALGVLAAAEQSVIDAA